MKIEVAKWYRIRIRTYEGSSRHQLFSIRKGGKMLKSLTSFILLLCGIAQAHGLGPSPTDTATRLQNLERKVQQLQNLIASHDNRLQNLEYSQGITPPGNVFPSPPLSYSAILIDTGYSKTFLGSGSTKLEAEAMVRQECSKLVHSSYCNGSVRFGSVDVGTRGSYCVITDSGYQKTFSARGANAIEAEAKAKQACQASVHSSYCGNVTPRCESIL